MKTLLAFLFSVGLIALAGQFAMEKGYIVNPFDSVDLDKVSVLNNIVTKTNELRKSSTRPPLRQDTQLDNWLQTNAVKLTPHNSSVKVLLNRLQMIEPSVASASAQFISSNKPEEVTEELQQWAEQLPAEKSDVAVYVFPKSAIQPYQAIMVAAEKLPEFSPALLGVENEGLRQRFFNMCASCEKPHVSTVTRESLAVALECPTCQSPYDLYAMRLDGSYCRVNELLTGYQRPADFPEGMSKYEEMLAIWRTVRNEFVYTTDLQGSRGPQDSWQTAEETSKIGNGDCEDTSIFMVDWLLSRGIDARVAIGIHIAGGGHAWCVARVDGVEFLLEATGGPVDNKTEPPLTSRMGNEYQPLAMFDRDSIYFRNSESAGTRYFAGTLWNRLEFTPTEEALNAPYHVPGVNKFALSADVFGKDRVPEKE